jgi:hypothetical protein
MESIGMGSPQMFRLWITTYANWRPAQWSDSPPTAIALEAVENALYSADEAALFLEGFNSAMLENSEPIWAVAVPVTVRYEGDAQPGMPVRGYVFACDRPALAAADLPSDPPAAGGDPAQINVTADPLQADHFHGFGQSPQRSR